MANNLTCTHHDLIYEPQTLDFLCKTAAGVLCKDGYDLYNFYHVYWCWLGGNPYIFLPLFFVAVFLIFKYTSIAVDEYIAEGIQRLSDFLGFSESLAAVTLLAFANGAGDVITALVASGAEGGVSYNIGALYGAGLFVCSMVVAICTFTSKTQLVYDKMIIFRDIGIYIIATLCTVAFGFYGKITWWTSSILLGLYVILVVVVLIEEVAKKPNKSKISNRKESMLTKGEEEGIEEQLVTKDKEEDDDSMSYQSSEEKKKVVGLALLTQVGNRPKPKGDNAVSDQNPQKMDAELNNLLLAVKKVNLQMFIKKKLQRIRKHRAIPLEEKTLIEKIMHLIELPFIAAMYLTSLPSTDHMYSKIRCVIYPIPGFLFIWYVIRNDFNDMTYLYYPLPAGALLSIIFMLVLDKDKAPKWSMVFTVMAIGSGLMWTYIMVGALIDMLNTLGLIFNLAEAFLGLTILAIGNALPDALTTLALIKQGAGTMAISGGYAGQLFGYLIGFGISMLKLTLISGKAQEFDIFNMDNIQENILEIIVIGVSLLVLLFTFLFGIFNKFVMNRIFGAIILCIYVVFLGGSTVIAVRKAVLNP